MDLIPAQYKKHGLLCRWIALEMLYKVLKEKKLISDIKADQKFSFWYLMPEEKARSLSLLEIVLRNLSVLDSVINVHLKQQPSLKILNILRVASAEILFDRIAIHAAVDSAVRLSKLDKKLARFSGLVNAICRKIAIKFEGGLSLTSPILDDQIVSGLRKTYDWYTIKQFSLVQAKRPPLDITVKHVNLEKYYSALLKGHLLPSGTIRLRHQNQVSRLQGYDDGDWWIQDFSAALPIKLLGNIDGMSALDVCAAPGGKTMQLVSGGARVTALDISTKRANLLLDNLSRTKLQANVKVDDFKTFDTENRFDIVLVDAPCSATGTIRRNCELQYLNPYNRIDILTKEQKSILKKAMLFVKPGGRLLYCTCSLVPSEGENIIKKIFGNNDNWTQTYIDGKNLGVNPKWVDPSGGLRLRPDYWATIGGMDGFYIAILRKEK